MSKYHYISTKHSIILTKIENPKEYRNYSKTQLIQLVEDQRNEIITVIAQREGHLGASLGVVELTVALHYVFDTPNDILVWDVGHQAYGHKMLTGRRKAFSDLRQWGGLSGFPKRSESAYDPLEQGILLLHFQRF